MDNEQIVPGFGEDMKEILDSYLVEAGEILDQLSQDLLALEKKPSAMNLLNNIFRGMHTLKGTSSFLGFQQMTDLTHACEDLLNKLRKGDFIADINIIDLLVEAHKIARVLLQRIESRNLQPVELGILNKLHGVLQQQSGITQKESVSVPVKEQTTPEADLIEALRQRTADTTIRVDIVRLDDLMNLVGELVLARNRLLQATQALIEKHEHIEMSKQIFDISSQVDFVTTELQLAIMKTRMLPIEKVFNGLPLLARDIMRSTGKDIDLQIYGKETELDKSIIEDLNDPLVHMLRNAIDHGIESLEERKKAGKPPQGTVVINAEREGNYIMITMEDDGCGIDVEQIKKKAIEKGIISEDQAREMSMSESLNLIFLPGFSTKQEATTVSGRGVGLDVVKTNITKLKGIVEVASDFGKGTIITLKVPLTLAIIQGLLMKVVGEIFAVPLNAVIEIVKLRPDEIYTIRGREVIRLRDSILPLARMSEIIGNSARRLDGQEPAKQSPTSYVVVVGWAEKRIGLLVDSLLGQKEVVIKTLGRYLGDIPGIAGSTILGDGSVILIIDIGQFVELFARHFAKVA